MKLSDIASVAGKGGLHRIVASNKSGLVLESLDQSKTKSIATGNQRISVLHEISIYTNTKEGSTPLQDVLKRIFSEFGDDLGIDPDSDTAELRSFMKSVLPDYDEGRVYASDIRKLVKWYTILRKEAPETISNEQ